jgi:hypothetical protein
VSRADQSPAIVHYEVDTPPFRVVLEVEQDPWYCSPSALPSSRDENLLLLEMTVREAQIHL